MKIKKGIALLISLALVIGTVLPGTLALSADEISSNGTIEVSAETPAPDAAEAPASEETVVLDETPTEESAQTCTCDPAPAEGEAHKEGCPLYVAPKQPAEEGKTCTCDPAPAEGEAHKEGCPLYVAPKQPAEEQKACTCDPAPAEGEAHKEGCPLYEAPEQPTDEQQPEEEQTDYTEVYEQLMAAETTEELDALLDSFADEAAMDEFLAWLDANDKRTALEEHIAALNEQETLEQEEDTAILPMVVPFTNVGPLLPATALRRANAPMAVAAANKDGNNGNGSSNNNNGLVLSKKAEPVEGGYKITMEAYATGASSTTVSTKPADIVLVLDMSGSMEYCIGCGKEIKHSDQKHEVAVYTPVYADAVNTNQSYYIQDGDRYVKVEYCAGNHLMDRYKHAESWLPTSLSEYGSDHANYLKTHAVIMPKTSADDTAANRVQFYTRTTNRELCTPRINALKSAVSGFIDSVGKLSPDSQIALVKFAGNKTTEIGDDTYPDYPFTYNYSQIVKSLTKVQGNEQTLKDAVNKLRPAGATRADYGMEHAQGIITNSGNNGHNKVVVMFTDGEPTSGSVFSPEVANKAISASKSIKDTGATVYTIGVFKDANGAPVESLSGVDDTNKYMHLVSSNYKNATSLTNTGEATYPTGGKSYYLSADNQSQLENIFQQISQETGGSSVEYGAETVIKDIVTPYFTMPANTTDIKLYTAKSNGNVNDWMLPESFNGSVTVQDNTVSVSGFSFKDNWCGNNTGASGETTFHNGQKLIIEFTVSPKEGFLGGNGVPTNDATSGVYHDNQLVGEFPVPHVNVPIKDVNVTAQDKNVYLLGNVTEDQLKDGAEVKCGNVTLELDKANYGLESWQTDYVKITTAVTKPDAALTADGKYTISVKVEPKPDSTPSTEGTEATEKTGTATGNINVFKPELTFKDSTAYYGADVPEYTGNPTTTEWKHGDTTDTSVTMTGDKPKLDITYTPETGKIEGNKINTKQDIGVDATVKIQNTDITDKTKFLHTDCTDKTCTLPDGKEFLIHVKTCTLEIKKTGGADDESYVFNVYKDGDKYSEVTVWGNGTETLVELPVGNYTIQEDTGWSWRYKADNGGNAELSAEKPNGSITCTNTKNNNQWLNGFSTVVRNIYGNNG